ncbi:MAG TPA: RNA polymerase sigma factor [Amnibacterium sp.]|uniref:RNA polymerase sigma factor n=1 Tax=Amnibacterium sp. TaxID=1872496 RepID=UPI002F9551C3
MSTDDADDWGRAIAGDGEAFGRIFDRHRPRVQRHLWRLLTCTQDVEDAVAIVFLEAWRKRATIPVVQGSLIPWLLLTATNVANNVRRSGRRYQALLAQLPPPSHANQDSDSFDEPDVVIALRGLSLADQQVLTLCVLEGWSELEVATALRVRPGTVKSRLHRAKKRLAERFGSLASSPLEGITHGL